MKNKKERDSFNTLSKIELNLFNKMEEISTYEDFKKNFEKLKKEIKSKDLGKNGDIDIKIN